ncbi:ALA-interacting subunit 1 [Stylosanthes scabra]|uniref:ALA-interacting subunit 1 n=1 Tax=Stylosanthes scabra TaxID=79078 RepID=A0ABU6U9M6_9FABA|nr:ALA-interacting subunit 1 [Stylosanthes scabra]
MLAVQGNYNLNKSSVDNFYQNHHRYVKSRNDEQLRDSSKWDSTSGCKPEGMTNGKPIVPCGLIAWSLFNDTYVFSRNNKNLTVNKKGISWKSDRDHKFRKDVFPKNFQNDSIIGGAHLNDSISVNDGTYVLESMIELHYLISVVWKIQELLSREDKYYHEDLCVVLKLHWTHMLPAVDNHCP